MAFDGSQETTSGERSLTPRDERLLSVEDLATYLDVPIKTIYAWRHHKSGPSGIRIGKHLRFRWSEVERWLAELATQDTH